MQKSSMWWATVLILVFFTLFIVFGMPKIPKEGYIEERFFEPKTKNHLMTIRATSQEKLQEAINAHKQQWQVERRYESLSTENNSHPYRANLVAIPGH